MEPGTAPVVVDLTPRVTVVGCNVSQVSFTLLTHAENAPRRPGVVTPGDAASTGTPARPRLPSLPEVHGTPLPPDSVGAFGLEDVSTPMTGRPSDASEGSVLRVPVANMGVVTVDVTPAAKPRYVVHALACSVQSPLSFSLLFLSHLVFPRFGAATCRRRHLKPTPFFSVSMSHLVTQLRIRDVPTHKLAGSGAQAAIDEDEDLPQVLHAMIDVESVVVDATSTCLKGVLSRDMMRKPLHMLGAGSPQEASAHNDADVAHVLVVGHLHPSPLCSGTIPGPSQFVRAVCRVCQRCPSTHRGCRGAPVQLRRAPSSRRKLVCFNQEGSRHVSHVSRVAAQGIATAPSVCLHPWSVSASQRASWCVHTAHVGAITPLSTQRVAAPAHGPWVTRRTHACRAGTAGCVECCTSRGACAHVFTTVTAGSATQQTD